MERGRQRGRDIEKMASIVNRESIGSSSPVCAVCQVIVCRRTYRARFHKEATHPKHFQLLKSIILYVCVWVRACLRVCVCGMGACVHACVTVPFSVRHGLHEVGVQFAAVTRLLLLRTGIDTLTTWPGAATRHGSGLSFKHTHTYTEVPTWDSNGSCVCIVIQTLWKCSFRGLKQRTGGLSLSVIQTVIR